MLKEIHEQPESLRQAITGRVTRTDHIWLEELEGFDETLRSIERIELVACGTAYYASLIGAAALQDWTGIPARSTVGSEFRYSPPPLDERTLVIAVTQSGETADTIAPTRLARERGCPVIAVTNTVGSAITREADRVLFLQAGPEIAVAASKTFVTQVTTLVVLAAAIAKTRGTMGAEQELELGPALRALPDAAARALDNCVRSTPDLARRYVNSRGFMFVGRGVHVPDGHGGRAQAQGGQLRPRRGVRGRRAQARPDLAARRRVPARRGRDALGGVRQADQQRHGGPRAGRARDRGGDRRRRRRSSASPTTCAGSRTRTRRFSPVLAIIPLQLFAYHVGGRAGHGRRPAAQPGEVGHRRVDEPWPAGAPFQFLPGTDASWGSTSSRSPGSATRWRASGRASRTAS